MFNADNLLMEHTMRWFKIEHWVYPTLFFFFHFINNGYGIDPVKTTFSGKEYIDYKIPERHDETPKDKITLQFKTIEPFGVILYSCGDEGDFLLLQMNRGKLVYTGSFGSDEGYDNTHSVMTDSQYNDNRWHRVTLLRINSTIFLTVDGKTKAKKPDSEFTQLNLHKSFLVGGMGNLDRYDTTCNNNARTKNFTGCLQDVHFNSINLLLGANEGFKNYKVNGRKLLFDCGTVAYEIFGMNSEKSSLAVQRNILVKNELKIIMEMRTFEPEGHVFTHETTDGSAVLNLINGKLQLSLHFFMATTDAMTSDVVLNDGDWHRVEVKINRNESNVFLNVDKQPKTYRFKSHFKLSTELGQFSSLIRFGGNTPKLPGLVNCYRRLEVDGQIISVKSGLHVLSSKTSFVSDRCSITDQCFPSPCQHDGKCSQSRGSFRCDCSNTGYSGPRCENCIYKRTCDEIKASGVVRSGSYRICPTNDHIFIVHCNMQTGATNIRHDSKNDTQVGSGHLFGTKKPIYYHSINYFTSMKNIRNLMNISLSCEQYIRYDCYKSHLLSGVSKERDNNLHYDGARWMASNSRIQHYWGGATPSSRKCGCAMDDSCDKNAYGERMDCNCDIADDAWRFDAGFLREKNLLPVKELQFTKGPETNERSRFTVGQLTCYGTVPKPTKATTTQQLTTSSSTIQPIVIDNGMFRNISRPTATTSFTRNVNDRMNRSVIVVEAVQNGSTNSTDGTGTIESFFSEPWLITIIIIGTVLCLLLVFMVFLLFRHNIYDIFMKCVYGDHVTKPRIEIEDYNRYSTATEEESDWDICRLSTTFPTSTPEPSYGPTDDESVTMRVRTLEDVRGKRRFKKLTGWGSRTASAPTVVGSLSKYSIVDKNNSFCIPNSEFNQCSSEYETKLSDKFDDFNEGVESERAYSTTATDGECDSALDDSISEFSQNTSHHSNDSSMKESECSFTASIRAKNPDRKQKQQDGCKDTDADKFYGKAFNNEGFIKPNAFPVSANPINGTKVFSAEPVKAYYPVLPFNGYRQAAVRRAHPVDYGSHIAMVNNNGTRCPRIVAVNRRVQNGGETYANMMKHPTIQEKDEFSDDDLHNGYDSQRNSDGFYEIYDPVENGSPSSETRLLFDDASSREECVREADEQIKLLKKKVIEKATSADECTQ